MAAWSSGIISAGNLAGAMGREIESRHNPVVHGLIFCDQIKMSPCVYFR
jgi:hypothetical protein